jgi:hypothetical protein
MTIIRLGGFRGEIPRIHPQLLPQTNAQTALNVRLDSGALESIKEVQTEAATTLVNPISLFRYNSSVWLESLSDNDWIPYPVVSDAFGRLIYVDPTVDELRVTDASRVGSGGTPSNYWRLDVPAPTQGFSVTLNGTADDEDEVPETRFYVCTFVNSYGAEGPPSPASNQVEWRTGQTVTISTLPVVPSGSYNIIARRLYRINTGSSGATEYQFVTEIAATQAQKIISTISKANPVVIKTTTAHGLTTGQEVVFSNLGTGTAKTITLVQKTNPVQVTTSGAHGFSSGWTIAIEGLGSGNGMDELDGVRGVINIVDSTKFTITGIDATGYTDYVTGGTAARAFGADELNGNQYFVSVIDTDEFSLDGIDGTTYKTYVEEGIVNQVAGSSYTDNIPSGNLAEVLPTEIYDPPNDTTEGIKQHPAGFLVGFYGKTLTFSEPGAPHAWPIDYRLVTNHDIVGLGVFGNTVVVTTKGWPYLAVGSDPSAMTMIELEIEQACVARRSIVDFGTVVAYASPDGLIVINGSGANNATAAIFTRDQWQALVPTSFVAFNWENKYLCFYDDGSTQRGFIIDPFAPEYGVRYVDKYATGGYRDVEEDLLYLVINNQIEKWDQSSTKLRYTWKSKPIYTPRATNMSAAKVFADAYPVTVEFYVDGIKRYTRVVTSIDAFRLPGGFRGEKFELVIKGKRRVSEVIMATTMAELSATV